MFTRQHSGPATQSKLSRDIHASTSLDVRKHLFREACHY